METAIIDTPQVNENNADTTTGLHFELVNEVEITIPENYNHSEQLTRIRIKNKDDRPFLYVDPNITSKNFNTTDQLQPGGKYAVELFKVLNKKLSWLLFWSKKRLVRSETILEFLQGRDASFVGAEGISLLRQLKHKFFLIEKQILSFDKKAALFKDPTTDNHRVPSIYREYNYSFSIDWFFSLRQSFEKGVIPGAYFICFRKLC